MLAAAGDTGETLPLRMQQVQLYMHATYANANIEGTVQLANKLTLYP